MNHGTFKDGTPDVGVVGLARWLARWAATTKLEAGQVWSNGKTTRTITEVDNADIVVAFKQGKGRVEQVAPTYIFHAWITRTGAILQETKP